LSVLGSAGDGRTGASPITSLYELEDFETAYVVTIGAVAHNSLALAERSFAQALEHVLALATTMCRKHPIRSSMPFLADEDLHNKATVWLALATAVLTESLIPRKIASCTLHCSSSGLALVRIRMPQSLSD
jgi:hypothetical protein